MNDSRTSAPSTTELSEFLAKLAAPSPARDDVDRIERIRRFEELKSALAAAQARETAAFVAAQRAAQLAAGVPAERAERGIAAQVALAKRCSAVPGPALCRLGGRSRPANCRTPWPRWRRP